MPYIRFKHKDGKFDIVRINGLRVCLDHGTVKEFYRPSEQQWIDPLKDPIELDLINRFQLRLIIEENILNT